MNSSQQQSHKQRPLSSVKPSTKAPPTRNFGIQQDFVIKTQTQDRKNLATKVTFDQYTENLSTGQGLSPPFHNALINSKLSSVNQSPTSKITRPQQTVNSFSTSDGIQNFALTKSLTLLNIQTQQTIKDSDLKDTKSKIPKISIPSLFPISTLYQRKAMTPKIVSEKAPNAQLKKMELRKQIEKEAFKEGVYSLKNEKDDESSSRHFTSSRFDFADNDKNKQYDNPYLALLNDPMEPQKHIQEININLKNEENDHINFIENLQHFKDQQKALDSNFDLIKQAISSFSSNSMGIKVKDKMYDVYSSVSFLYHDHVQTKKSIESTKEVFKEAQGMLTQVSELVRMLIRLFITEHKFHISLMLEKLFKMFVGFFDSMYEVQEAKITEMRQELSATYQQERKKQERFIKMLENEISLLRKFKLHDQQAQNKKSSDALVENLKDMQEEIEFIQKNAAMKNIYEDIEVNTKRLEKFLNEVGENTEKQIVNIREMRNIINYDAIISERDLVSLDVNELQPFTRMFYGNLMLYYWTKRSRFMSEEFFFDQFINLMNSKLNSEIYYGVKSHFNFSQYMVKKYLQILKDPHQTVIEVSTLVKRKCFEYPEHYTTKLSYQIVCTSSEMQTYMILLYGELFNKSTNQLEETNLERLVKFMKQYWIEDIEQQNEDYNYQKQLLTKIKHRVVKKFFKLLSLVSDSETLIKPLNIFDHFELQQNIENERKENFAYLAKNSFRDFKLQHEQMRKIKIEEHAQQIMGYLTLYDKNFSKHFSSRFKEKDDLFGVQEIDQILNSHYLDILTKYDMKVLAHFFRLKFGDTMNIIQFECEYERAIELLSYKHYSAVNCLNALNLALYDFAKYQIKIFEKEFLKAQFDYEQTLESKRVKGNFYEAITFQHYQRIMYSFNPILEEDDITQTYAHSIGMVKVKEQVQMESETEEEFAKKKEQYEIALCRKYLELTVDSGLLIKNLLELNKVEEKKSLYGTKNVITPKSKMRTRHH